MSDEITLDELKETLARNLQTAKIAGGKVGEASAAVDIATQERADAKSLADADPANERLQTIFQEKSRIADTKAAELKAANAAKVEADAAVVVAKSAWDTKIAAEPVNGSPETKSPAVTFSSPATTSYFDLMRAVIADPHLTSADKTTLLIELKGVSPTSDRLTYRTAILILGFIAALTIVAIWHLVSIPDAKIPDGLIAIASGAVGGLAGLLSSSSATDSRTP